MSTLKKSKLLQMIIGVLSAVLLLLAGYILGEKITFPQTAFWNIAELVILIAYILIYTMALLLLARFAKKHNLKALYYPAFVTCLTSVISAIVYWQTETSFRLLTIFISKALGKPILVFSEAVEKATLYHNKYDYDEFFLFQYDIVGILLIITIASLTAYQLYTKTEDHSIKLARWHLEGSARTAALAMIISYGSYSLLIFILNISHNFIVPEILYTALAILSMLLTITMCTFVLSIILIPYLIIIASKQAIETRNPRKLFNPLVLLAIFLTIAGTWVIYTTTMHCF